MNGNTNIVPASEATATARQGILAWAGQQFGVETGKVMGVLKATCFSTGKGEPEATDAEVAGLLVVSRAYNLNPFLREIFAFRDKKGGIVPVVGVDGWSRIINDQKQLDGLEFRYSPAGEPEWIECVIYRKDRSKPTVVRELLSECKRDTQPWKTHTSRMLRHKALIQCARIAFGFAGIYDEDEAARITEIDVTPAPELPLDRGAAASLKAAIANAAPPPAEPAADADDAALKNLEGTQAMDSTKAEKGKDAPKVGPQPGTPEKRDEIMAALRKAETIDALAEEADKANLYEWTKADLGAINGVYHEQIAKLSG